MNTIQAKQAREAFDILRRALDEKAVASKAEHINYERAASVVSAYLDQSERPAEAQDKPKEAKAKSK